MTKKETIETLEKLIQLKDETIKELERQLKLAKEQQVVINPFPNAQPIYPWYPQPNQPWWQPLSPPYIITSGQQDGITITATGTDQYTVTNTTNDNTICTTSSANGYVQNLFL